MNIQIKRVKFLNLLLLLTSLMGYLQWGGNNHMFLFRIEMEVITGIFSNPLAHIHPFIILPIIGQLFLLITIFQNTPSLILTVSGTLSLTSLLGFIFIIGILSREPKILLSTIPFLTIATYNIWHVIKSRGDIPS